jgi:hypothetical protein
MTDDVTARVIGNLCIRYRLAGLSPRAARRHAERDVASVSDPLTLLSRRARRRTPAELAKRGDIIDRLLRMDYVDITITCVGCKQPFVWTAGQQAFFAERQLLQPRRCPACRQARRLAQQAEQEGVSR